MEYVAPSSNQESFTLDTANPARGEYDAVAPFYIEVAALRAEFEELRNLISDARLESQRSLDWQAGRRDAASRDGRAVTAQAKRQMTSVSERLKKMAADLPAPGTQGLDADTRSRQMIHASLSQEFIGLLTELQQVQMGTDEGQRRLLAGQLRIIDRNITDEQINTIMKEGTLDSVMQDSLFSASRADEVRSVYDAARRRHDDIMEIERSIAELHQLMVDLNALLSAQSEVIDSIEAHVQCARQNTTKSVKYLEDAVTTQSKSRKRRMWIILIAVIVIVFMVVGITLGFIV